MTGIDARQANVASFRVSFSVFSTRKTPLELAISIKNNETEETNMVRSADHNRPRIYTQEHLTEYCHRIAGLSIRNFGSRGSFFQKHAVIHDFSWKLRSFFYSSAKQAEPHVQFQNSFSTGVYGSATCRKIPHSSCLDCLSQDT
jgi:hypothetical protein